MRQVAYSAQQGGDTQDQNLLQFFLNVVEFGMDVQEAVEAANITSYQMRNSFGEHKTEPGRLTLRDDTPSWVRHELRAMGYRLDFDDRTSGPIDTSTEMKSMRAVFIRPAPHRFQYQHHR